MHEGCLFSCICSEVSVTEPCLRLSAGCRHTSEKCRSPLNMGWHHEELRTCNCQLLLFQIHVFLSYLLEPFVPHQALCLTESAVKWILFPLWNRSPESSAGQRPKPPISQQAACKLKDARFLHPMSLFRLSLLMQEEGSFKKSPLREL